MGHFGRGVRGDMRPSNPTASFNINLGEQCVRVRSGRDRKVFNRPQWTQDLLRTNRMIQRRWSCRCNPGLAWIDGAVMMQLTGGLG